jgi:SAM-dependent methyltransferase
MNTTCLNCGKSISKNARQWSLNDRRKGLTGNWQLIECDHCEVIFMMPMPTDEQLAQYYAAYSKDDKVDLSLKAGSKYPKIRKLFHALSGDVDPRDFIKVPNSARILDYGCGHAGYLSDFHNRGINISGAEIADYVVKACQKRSFDVHKVDDFSHIPFADEEFDVVYLMQVFEHLREPHGFMKELFRVMKKGGTLYLALPNSASIWLKVFGENWVSGWFAPFHLFHYNCKSLSALANQHGFDVMKSWSRTPESWFRLNLKAWLHPEEKQLDSYRSRLDDRWIRYLLMLMLRIVELPFRERDCLVIELIKR